MKIALAKRSRFIFQFARASVVPRGMSINSVVPIQLHDRTSSRHALPDLSLSSWVFMKVLALRHRIKISRLGKYSAKRVEAVIRYCQQTFLLQVLLVTLLMPWPALILELVCEWIPLQDPSSGWKANYGAYIRIFIAISSATGAALFQIRAVTPRLSYLKMAVIAVGCGLCAACVMLTVAQLWVFPVPFGFFIFGPAATVSFMTLFVLLARQKGSRSTTTPTAEGSLKMQVCLIGAQVMLATIYIIFNIAFTKSTPRLRVALVLLLPVMKISLKNLLARLVVNNPESIPVAVVFTVDVFNGLFTSICMQSSGSWWTSLLMIALNVFYTALSAMDINSAAKAFQEHDLKSRSISRRNQAWNTEGLTFNSRDRSSSLILSAKIQTRASLTDTDVTLFASTRRLNTGRRTSITAMKAKLSSCLLFQMEYRALVGYTEVVVPLLYAVNLAVLVHLPSAQYYPHTRLLTTEQLTTTMGSIAVYVSTELISLLWLHVMVKRKLGFSLFYELAFVLETAMEQLQGRLFVWIIILLQLPLQHFGIDFSFQFEWINSQATNG